MASGKFTSSTGNLDTASKVMDTITSMWKRTSTQLTSALARYDAWPGTPGDPLADQILPDWDRTTASVIKVSKQLGDGLTSVADGINGTSDAIKKQQGITVDEIKSAGSGRH
ncbi:hypothetical protein [Streptomyces flaveolus]|jgi:hypothetical protein|uniref:hypothetical protein n=1 Tax=Streptomyces flaveolus TaxID=67297 RepID=UPI001670D495|nr:hypothetical protein [Streptomyces flaveolus]GGQ79304.1 hypothetical protein GCM10010216_46490 [Streptomyces flaveolus]